MVEHGLRHLHGQEHSARRDHDRAHVDRLAPAGEPNAVLYGERLAGAVDAGRGRCGGTGARAQIDAVRAADGSVARKLDAAESTVLVTMRSAPVKHVVHDRAASVGSVARDGECLEMRDLGSRTCCAEANVIDVELRTLRNRHLAAGRAAVGAERVRPGVETKNCLLSVGNDDILSTEVRAVERDRARTAERDGVASRKRAVALEGVVVRARQGDRTGRLRPRHRDVARRSLRAVDERGDVRNEPARRAAVVEPVRTRRVPAEVGGAIRTPRLRGHGCRDGYGHR